MAVGRVRLVRTREERDILFIDHVRKVGCFRLLFFLGGGGGGRNKYV